MNAPRTSNVNRRNSALLVGFVGLILLLTIHILWLYVIARESPVWFNSIFLVRGWLATVIGDAPSFRVVGALFVVYGGVIAWFLWQNASRVAAVLWLPTTLWDVWFRFTVQLNLVISEGYTLGLLMILGCAATVVAVLVNGAALWGAFITSQIHEAREN